MSSRQQCRVNLMHMHLICINNKIKKVERCNRDGRQNAHRTAEPAPRLRAPMGLPRATPCMPAESSSARSGLRVSYPLLTGTSSKNTARQAVATTSPSEGVNDSAPNLALHCIRQGEWHISIRTEHTLALHFIEACACANMQQAGRRQWPRSPRTSDGCDGRHHQQAETDHRGVHARGNHQQRRPKASAIAQLTVAGLAVPTTAFVRPGRSKPEESEQRAAPSVVQCGKLPQGRRVSASSDGHGANKRPASIALEGPTAQRLVGRSLC